tara:strand:- start:2834 stop:3058 length:225 start_codon:yes stop_codon:yes gene_type:complete
MEKDKVHQFVSFQFDRKVTSLYKSFLCILDELRDGQYNISEEVLKGYRKRILDSGNDARREIEEILEKIEVEIK